MGDGDELDIRIGSSGVAQVKEGLLGDWSLINEMRKLQKRLFALQGQPQCLKKAMIVGFPSLETVILGVEGAFSPTFGGSSVLT